MILAFILAAVMNFVSYFFSDKIALAMVRAQPVTREQLPRAYAGQVERPHTENRHSSSPKIYVIPGHGISNGGAFATGAQSGASTPRFARGPHGILSLPKRAK